MSTDRLQQLEEKVERELEEAETEEKAAKERFLTSPENRAAEAVYHAAVAKAATTRESLNAIRLEIAKGAAAAGGQGQAAGVSEVANTVVKELKEFIAPLVKAAAERLSQTQAASKITPGILQEVRDALKASCRPVRGNPPLEELLGVEGEEEKFWDDDFTENQQWDDAIKTIKEKLNLSGRPQVHWLDVRNRTLKRRFGDLLYKVSARNDELLTLRSWPSPEGALLGIELKKKLSWQGVRQAEMEFYLFQSTSQFPFCHVVTDLSKGGVAYYSDGNDEHGDLVIWYKVFTSMRALYAFVRTLINKIPASVDECLNPRAPPETTAAFPDELQSPRRVKPRPPQPSLSHEERQQLFWQKMDSWRAAEDDVACHRDLVPWSMYS